ncbi:hypothetical protein [Dactylosporangium sp. CA-092794]|uniref:hypothetical protein n=1 Tax=Dactylosporangium sp. CA-092794 TaxID=3239929 RepID=UPI003D8FAA4C
MTTDATPTDFDRKYSALLIAVWRSDTEMAKLLADPTAYAIQAGLPVEAGATVTVDGSQPDGLLTRTEIVEAWSRHVLRVPEQPLASVEELSDAELDVIAAGSNNINLYKSK